MFLLLFSVFIALVYLWWVLRVFGGWKKYAIKRETDSELKLGISIVIPFRNEAINLPILLESISALKYPLDKIEVVLVDDASDDGGAEIVKQWKAQSALSIVLLNADGSGKKAAQYSGIKHASHAIIACTDADCVLPENWLENINAGFSNSKVELLFGPVTFMGKGNKLQRLEFLSLIGSTMAMLELGWPVMGNAANMACKKATYLDVFPNLEMRQSPSGDDVFLLHEIARKEGAVAVLHGKGAIVQTKPQENIKAFLMQRIRWASKAKLYTNQVAVAVATLVFFTNLLLLLFALAIFYADSALASFSVLFLIKCAVDYMLLKSFASYFKQEMRPFIFFAQEFLNIIYIPAVAVLSQLFSYTWKGRKH